MNVIFIASFLFVVHNVDGEAIAINPKQVTTLHPTHEDRGTRNSLVAPGIRCVIGLSSGKVVSVVEDCDDVRKMMEEIR